ncbi:unnamed protein product [Rhizophagus irregularis]|uniref:RNase H type-1 domain-containing protein n=1 Tax=Rhizophagus irregularis TaxID=588596 RepID=A0A915YR52_9GLOM|nr:unnamed protein product [Rhizophagus irregularis]
MAALLSPKKLLAQHVTYLYNVVLLPKLKFRLVQTTVFAESTINRMVSPILSLVQQKAGLASVTPLSALFTLLPFSIQHAFGRFLSSHVALWQKIFSHPSYKLFANYMITYLQGFLDCDACPSTIDLELWSHTFSLRTHSLFNSLLFSSRLNITWSLLFRPLRKDLRPAISLRSILPKDLFISMKNVQKNFCTRFLAQLVTPCGSRLLSWKDLRFLKRVSNKGSVPAWFNYLFNLIVISNSLSFFVLPQFRIPNSHTVASISCIDISQNYLFNPQWAISFNRITNSFLVGRVIITYPALRNEALISHWIASSVDDLLSEFTACQGCTSAIPRSSTSKTLLKRYPSEKCFSYVPLSSLIRYPTKPRTYIHADTRSVLLSASLDYAKSLLLFHLFALVRPLPMNKQVPGISDIQLPSSVSTFYIDGSFLPLSSHSLPLMAYAWTAINSDGFILKSHYNIIPSLFPSALRSEIFALLHGLDSLPQNSKITVTTDCAQLISLWSTYMDTPFIPKMLKESNHLLWFSVQAIISQKSLEVTLIEVPAHADDSLNNHVDDLAKAAHTDSHLSLQSPALLAPCILQFNSLPVDMNIWKFIGDIFDAKNLLTLALLPRFNLNSSISNIDWACTKFCFNNKKLFFSYRNGRSEFCAFRIKILLDMLLTLTTLQKRKPHVYDTSWLCPQCNSSSETLDHLWTCPYILPEFSPFNTFKTLLLDLQTVYLDKFLSATPLISLPDFFVAEFMAIDCWDCDPPSPFCLRLARGLIPISLTGFLGTYFSSSIIRSILDAPLHDFHFDLYVQIWLCRSVFFHHWESAQGITNKMKSSAIGPSPISHPSSQISPEFSTPSLATASLDSWVSWVSFYIIRGGSWISHLDFWRRLTVQPLLRISFW